MRYRIRARFSPPTAALLAGVLPMQCERECELEDVPQQLRELLAAGDSLMKNRARLVIEIVVSPWERDAESGDFE